ncbi:MAG TPA: LapA family protein [Devosiaceae bacterium]|jgi:uncharacterized integral membrane protein
MVKRIAGWIVLVPLCGLLIVFALANRQLVIVNFNPFVSPQALTAPGFGVPLFLVIYAVLLIGVLLGGVATWLAQGRVRREKRQWRKEAEYLTRELDGLRKSSARPQDGRALLEVDDFLDKT